MVEEWGDVRENCPASCGMCGGYPSSSSSPSSFLYFLPSFLLCVLFISPTPSPPFPSFFLFSFFLAHPLFLTHARARTIPSASSPSLSFLPSSSFLFCFPSFLISNSIHHFSPPSPLPLPDLLFPHFLFACFNPDMCV